MPASYFTKRLLDPVWSIMVALLGSCANRSYPTKKPHASSGPRSPPTSYGRPDNLNNEIKDNIDGIKLLA